MNSLASTADSRDHQQESDLDGPHALRVPCEGLDTSEIAGSESPPGAVAGKGQSSYGQILRSSAIIGGSSLINVAVGILRTKAFAIILGPAGVGLMGAYTSVAELVRSVAEMGVTRSGVRQIAEAAGTNDTERIVRTVIVLRRVSVLLGLLGAGVLLLLATPIAAFTFGTSERYASGVMLLSLAVLLNVIAGGQSALLQGMRRIGDLARVMILGSALGTAAAIPIVYWLGESGVVPALIAIAGLSVCISWWYARKVQVARIQVSVAVFRTEAGSLLQLGMAFMLSGVMMMGAAYAVRVIVLRQTGLDGAGLYQAGWTLGGLYVGFILQAMGTDFYPRLVADAANNAKCNQLVNEQARISVLLAGPGVIGTLVLSPLMLHLFYSDDFAAAVDVLRWTCLGMALRVITWPMGFIIVAKNRQLVFIIVEVAWAVVNVGLSGYCVERFGLSGAGIAFFLSYVFHAVLVYPIVNRISGFTWSGENRGCAGTFLALVGLAFASLQWLPTRLGYACAVLLLCLSSLHSLRSLLDLVSTSKLPRPVLRMLALFNPSERMARAENAR
jgi:antigen flippase